MSIKYDSQFFVQPVATSDEDHEWSREQNRAHQAFHDMGCKIRNATTSGKRMQPVVRNFLRNPQVRLSAALRALGGKPDRETATNLRDRVDAWATGYAPIHWHSRRKPNGSTRPICTLPPEAKAVHYLLAMVIKQQLERSETLYGITDFGRDTAARDLKTLHSAGYVYLAQTDITDCFQSIDPDALYQLPLPKEVTHRALDIRNLTITEEYRRASQVHYGSPPFRGHTLSHKASGPKGLMQGSPASSIILAWLLNGIPTSDDARVLLCFDNIVVAARTPAGSREMVDTLAAHFERCPAGSLALCEPEYADNTPMEFLGYVFDPSRDDIGIGEKARGKLERRLIQAEKEDASELQRHWDEHQSLVRDNELFRNLNPFEGHYPRGVWREIRDFRAGFPAAQADGEEMMYYLETSAHVAEMRQSSFITHLHNNLIAPHGTTESDALREILKTRV